MPVIYVLESCTIMPHPRGNTHHPGLCLQPWLTRQKKYSPVLEYAMPEGLEEPIDLSRGF
jgi:hypothetical protein